MLDWQDDVLALPSVTGVKSAFVFGSGAKIAVQQVSGATLLTIPQSVRDPIDTIIVLEQ